MVFSTFNPIESTPALITALKTIAYLLWLASSYPLIYENKKRKSTTGLSLDFVILNMFGSLLYLSQTILSKSDSDSLNTIELLVMGH